MMLGALEAGGTKMVCAVGNESGEIFDQVSIPTLRPEETMPEMAAYFKQYSLDGLGIACFGPIDPVKGSATYGRILKTPKEGWQNVDMAGYFGEQLGCPVGFDTDVNGSVLGEVTYGAARNTRTCIYVTIGTGIGAGSYLEGKLHHGLTHAEAGHILVRRHEKDTYAGHCPFHGDCFEGMAAGPAIEERWGAKAYDLADRPEVWEMEAWYIAQACMTYTLVYSPERIILGGGVMHQEQLFPLIRSQFLTFLGGYLGQETILDAEHFIVPCSLNDNQGILGCLKLAADAAEEAAER